MLFSNKNTAIHRQILFAMTLSQFIWHHARFKLLRMIDPLIVSPRFSIFSCATLLLHDSPSHLFD